MNRILRAALTGALILMLVGVVQAQDIVRYTNRTTKKIVFRLWPNGPTTGARLDVGRAVVDGKRVAETRPAPTTAAGSWAPCSSATISTMRPGSRSLARGAISAATPCSRSSCGCSRTSGWERKRPRGSGRCSSRTARRWRSDWGATPGWADRRGFDSLVQVATGIGWATSTDGTRPGTLPCQLLDHATGYLVAAGALAALAHRARTGEATHVSLSLARTARWLLDQGPAPARASDAEDPPAEAYRTGFGNGWTGISPPGRIDGQPLRWPHLPPAYTQAPPAWPVALESPGNG